MTMVNWDFLELSPDWEEAAGDCGLLAVPNDAAPNAAAQNAAAQNAAVQSVVIMPKLRRLGPYENVGSRMPPSVGLLVILLLAALCIFKAIGR